MCLFDGCTFMVLNYVLRAAEQQRCADAGAIA
jgi:hypothetical protein